MRKARGELASATDLSLADEEREAAGWNHQASGDGQSGVEAFDGAQGDHVGLGSEAFGAAGEYIDVRQCKAADDFAQEGRLLLVRFNQCELDVGRINLDGKAGEASTGANVDYVRNSAWSWVVALGG